MPNRQQNRRPQRPRGKRPAARPRLPMAVVIAQAEATMARPLRVLPASWREPGVAERMGAWIEEHVPLRDRPNYNYGKGALA